MATVTERVVLDETSPTRTFANAIKLELRENGTAISSTVTRAVLTLTDVSGAETVLDSSSNFTLSWSSGVLTLDLTAAISTAGVYKAHLDVLIGSAWYRWTLHDSLVLVAQ